MKENKRQPGKDRQTLNKLLKLNDLNERAFAYHHYCLRKTEPMNEQFLKNLEATANLLFDEVMEQMNWEPQRIVDQIVKRRESIQQQLGHHYLTKGCHSAEGITARDHYRAFSQWDKEIVSKQSLRSP